MQLPKELLCAPQHDRPAVEAGFVTRPANAFSDRKVTPPNNFCSALAISGKNGRLAGETRVFIGKKR